MPISTLPGYDSISLATRYMEGGRDQFVLLVQRAMLNNEPLACKWWTGYADLPPYTRQHVSFDDICAATGVEPSALCAVIVSTAMRFGRDVANMVAALTHPKVVAAQATSAERINGDYAEISYRDRLSFLQAMGFAPIPKGGAVINVHASANAQAAAAASSEPTVPSFADDLAQLSTPRRALPSPDSALAPIDVTAQPVREAVPATFPGADHED